MNYLTNNLGEVIEDDEKITCYVKKNKIKKNKNIKYSYAIDCSGIENDDHRKKIAKAYNLDKPICYVFDGFELRGNLSIFSGSCEVIIKNCSFDLGLFVIAGGKITLDNTYINIFNYLSIYANELVIKNMRSEQLKEYSRESMITFDSHSKLDLIDSNIGNNEQRFRFCAKDTLNIVNSNVTGKEIECESKSSKINADEKSSLTASNKVSLKTDDFNSINITAPLITINGEELVIEKGKCVFKKSTNLLELKRLELISFLKELKKQCESINTKKVSKYGEMQKAKHIGKILQVKK